MYMLLLAQSPVAVKPENLAPRAVMSSCHVLLDRVYRVPEGKQHNGADDCVIIV